MTRARYQGRMKQQIIRLRRRALGYARRNKGVMFASSTAATAILVFGLALLWPPQPAPTTAVAAIGDIHHYTFAERFEGAK